MASAKPLASTIAQKESTVVVLLGTGTPNPDPTAQGPATAVVLGSRVFLFDAGPGVMRQMRAAGLSIRGPEAVFFTHLNDLSTDDKSVLPRVVLRRLVPAADYLHMHFAAGKVQFDVQSAFLANQIIFFYTDRRDKK